jgi:hypothetical protein
MSDHSNHSEQEEEEVSEEEEEYVNPVLPVANSPGDLSQPPLSGEEYLARVRLEAQQITRHHLVSSLEASHMRFSNIRYPRHIRELLDRQPVTKPKEQTETQSQLPGEEKRLQVWMDHHATNHVSQLHAWYSTSMEMHVETCVRFTDLCRQMVAIKNVHDWTAEQCASLYAAMLRLQKPIDSEVASHIRDVARMASQHQPPSAPCCVLLVVCRFFGQY